jgi:CSLREA domain-containing protein
MNTLAHTILRTTWFKRSMRLLLAAVMAAGLALGTGPVPRAHAATFAVNSTVDAVDVNPGDGVCETAPGNGVCTLRAAIQEANALPGDDSISLPAGTYELTYGEISIDDNLTLTGSDANTTIVDAMQRGRALVMGIYPFIAVTISNVTIKGGRIRSYGGGIYNQGQLTLDNSIVRDNVVLCCGGGGIFNSGILILNRSSVVNNSAQDTELGGGIFNSYSLSLTDSLVANNRASYGGGIFNNSGTLTLIRSSVTNNIAVSGDGGAIYGGGGGLATIANSTISSNTAGGRGGGIYNFFYRLTMTNTTINGNTASGGGGTYNQFGGNIYLANSILSGNYAPIGPNCLSNLVSLGHNLIQSSSDCNITGDTASNLIGVDPLLGPLQDNGGPTWTHALLPGSPAIDAGNPAGCTDDSGNPLTTDQRGVARPQRARCDIGAFEFDDTPPITTASISGTPASGCGADPFYFGSASVTLTTNEPATTQYRLNRGEWQTYAAPFIISDEGVITVEFYSTDVAGNVETAQSVSVFVTTFPAAGVLDNFDRANGGLGSNWSGSKAESKYKIMGQQVDVGNGGPIYWRSTSFGSSQEAYITLVNVDNGEHEGLQLKVQGKRPNWKQGTIEVFYNAATGMAGAQTYVPHSGWNTLATFPATLANGDRLGARALADGTVKVYHNCLLIGQTNAGSFFVDKGGWIGLWFINAHDVILDDFGGGETP